jgi:hypothetical protein
MPSTYTPLATTTLGSSASSVTLSSISGSYTDLILVVSAISTGTAQPDVFMQVNSSSTNYSRTRLGGNGSSAFTTNITGEGAWVIGPMENTASTNMIVQLMNYSNTTTFKTALIRSNDSAIAVQAMVGLWRFTNAINSIYLYPEPAKGDFAAGSTFTLYGVKSA